MRTFVSVDLQTGKLRRYKQAVRGAPLQRAGVSEFINWTPDGRDDEKALVACVNFFREHGEEGLQ